MLFSYDPKKDYFTFYNYENFADGTMAIPDKIPYGTFILDFLELDIDDLYNTFVKHIKKNTAIHIHYVDGYDEAYNVLSKKYNSQIIALILDELFALFYEYNYIDADKIIKNILYDSLNVLRKDLIQYIQTKEIRKFSWIELFSSHQKITVSIKPYTDSPELYMEYEIKDIISLISLDFYSMQSKNIYIKQCENCGLYFIPSKRSDEIYCDRIFKNDKTCKEVGYVEKEKKDPIKNLYTTARKTQHARIRYNSHIPDYKNKHFEPWKKAAEEARDRFHKANDIEGFKKWLEDNKDAF